MKAMRLFAAFGLALGLASFGWTLLGARAQDAAPAPTGLIVLDAPAEGAEKTDDLPADKRLERRCTAKAPGALSLGTLADWLRSNLKVQVVVDRAALRRKSVLAESTLAIEPLQGVRLKTALRLWLDQQGLTYRVEPDDDLIVITDAQAAHEREERLLAEIRDMHRDIHDLQDSVEELFQAVAPEDAGPAMRNPTIIEEKPAEEPGKGHAPHARTRPG